MSLISPIFGPSQPPQSQPSQSQPPASSGGGEAAPPEEGSQTQPVQPADEGQDVSDAGSDATQAGAERKAASLVPSAATPYVALPAVDADAVAAAVTEGEARARLDAAFAPDAASDRARLYAEAAEERRSNEALIAAITPPPENAPSLRGDAASIAEGSAREAPAFDALA